ncbi:MAG TPA: hypothetical protein VGG28_24355, partial [Kofleriaceae bacterium]
ATDDSWRGDLHTLATELPARHVGAFAHVLEPAWRADVAAVDAALPGLDEAHAIASFTRLVAELGDGHTRVVAPRHGFYRLALAWFDDGIFVIGADEPWAVGRRLVAVGTHSIDQAIAALTPLVSHDNAAGLHGELPDLLVDPVLLAGVDLAPSSHAATFVLAASDGTTRELALEPAAQPAAVVPPSPLPLHLRGPSTSYWNTYDDADHLVYVAYNACADDPRAGSFASFAARTLAFVDSHQVDRFVIDLRRNGGGDSSVIEPMIDGLATRPALAGRVFVIIGMHTFSSAVMNAIELVRRLHARLVGGPSAGAPTSDGEVKTFALPHSHVTVRYSTKHWEYPDFPGDALVPDLPVTVRAADWFAGRDPAIDAIVRAPVPAPTPAPLHL